MEARLSAGPFGRREKPRETDEKLLSVGYIELVEDMPQMCLERAF